MANVEVPYEIGDIAYHIGKRDKKVHVSVIKRIIISRSGVCVRLRCGKKGMVGKDVFLTEQEAARVALRGDYGRRNQTAT